MRPRRPVAGPRRPTPAGRTYRGARSSQRIGPLILGQGLARTDAGGELHAKARGRREIARRTPFDTAADFGYFAAVAAEHDSFVPLFDGLDQLGEPRLCLVHVDRDHIS